MAHAVWSVPGAGRDAVLHLRPDGSVFSPASSDQPGTLWVADVHLGKVHQYRALGMPVGERVRDGSDTDTLSRLCAALLVTGAERLVVLGDLVHGVHTGPALKDLVERLADTVPALSHTVLVCGNHDVRPGSLPLAGWQLVPETSGWRQGPWCGVHAPPVSHHAAEISQPATVHLAGHLHPCLRLLGPGRDALRLPCFWLQAAHQGRPACLVLPAFGSFTGGHPVQPAHADTAWVVADGRVLAVPGRA
jgi:uncharacterized protein